MKSWRVLVLILLCSCASQPNSEYKKVSEVPIMYEGNKQWHICRDGSLSDNAQIAIYLDDKFVANLNKPSLWSKNRFDIVENKNDKGNLTLEIKSNNVRQKLSEYSRSTNTENNIYIVIASNTTSGFVLPLPFITVLHASGNRKVMAVTKQEFEGFCGNVTPEYYLQ